MDGRSDKYEKDMNSTDRHSANEQGCRSHRGSGRRRVGMSMKLFGFLVAFTFIILAVVWVLQIGFLNYFYEQTKYNELERADIAIVNSIEKDDTSIEDVVKHYSADYLLCIRVFRLDNGLPQQIFSADVSSDCIIHHISRNYIASLYNLAAENDGLFVKQYKTGGYIGQSSPFNAGMDMIAGAVTPHDRFSVGAVQETTLGEGFPNIENIPQFPLETSGNEAESLNKTWGGTYESSINTVYVRLHEDSQGNEYIIMLNSEMAPLSTTVQMLKTQFFMIAVILLICALIMSFVISKNISKPIVQMNEAAKQLSSGSYIADFGAQGYREVIELSDTLSSAAEELNKNAKLQKELIANISHDLRTPLTMITGYSEVMRDIPGENTPENVQVVIDETRRLSELVNDLLDLSKLQAGTIKPEIEQLDLTELVCETMGRYEKLTRHDEYKIEFISDRHVSVCADKTMLLQVIYNLINNAINYTGEDKYVCVKQDVLKDTERVRISVTDSGGGIEPDMIPLIWDRYYKVDKVHRRAMVGTGLGLSIVKQILEQHDAAYGVESQLGHGSTFWFEFDIFNNDEDMSEPIDASYEEI